MARSLRLSPRSITIEADVTQKPARTLNYQAGDPLEPLATPRWIHRWAVLTVCATVALLALGAIVTTFHVGMTDPIWPTTPWHLLFVSWQEPGPGFLIEHSHRLAGYIVGCCTIILAIGLWRYQSRRWLAWLGMAALAGVIAQGLLGGFRVRLNALVGTDLALVHGCFAQLVFALLVSLAVFTSQGWATAKAPFSSRLRRWSLLTTIVVYTQLVLGGFVRHTSSGLGQRGHLLIAFAVVASVVWLLKIISESQALGGRLTFAASLLAGLVILQIVLGVEAWMIKFSGGMVADLKPITPQQGFVRTAHFLAGSGIFATAVTISLLTYRQQAAAVHAVPAPTTRLEGAA